MRLFGWLSSVASGREASLADLDRFRRVLFLAGLAIGGVLAVNVAMSQMEMIRPEQLWPARGLLLGWAALHVPFFLLSRRDRPQAAYLGYLTGSFAVILLVFAAVQLEPVMMLGLQCTYHAGILLLALLLLPFAEYAVFAVATGSVHVVFALVRLSHLDLPNGAALAVGLMMPLTTMVVLTVGVALLLERYLVGIQRAQAELRTQNERLEVEVRRRTQVIEEQQQQLLQMAKMEAIGTLAGGVAHDFNNLLTPILALASEIRHVTAPEDEAHEAAELITQSARKAAQLNRQLLGFARKGKLQALPVDLRKLVEEVAGLLERTLERKVEIALGLSAMKAHVVGDPVQLQQIVLNLAVNARDAMPHGGTLRFTTRNQELPGAGPKDLSPAWYLVLEVSDTGTGIPPEVQGRIFEPFFTTKPAGQGTGMGLAMVYGSVKNHGGAIEVESEVGKGSTFRVWLPATDGKASAKSGRHAAYRGNGRLLVVDDEDLVRASAARLLKGMGYEVTTAGDGVEALTAWGASGPGFDLVLLDLGMPRMDGLTCLRKLKQQAPEARVLISTGYANDGAAQEALEAGACGCLHKPYEVAALADAVRKALHPPAEV